MVKLTPARYRKPHVAADLSTREGRKRARREMLWGDHGFLRARFRNLHRISPEMWRANQPSPHQIAEYARVPGLKTIINLRGPSTRGFYLLEKEACETAGIALVDFQLFSRDPPTRDVIFAARDLFETIAYPALMHCKSGADRAGTMAVLYKLLREKVPYPEAAQQLSAKYLHVRHGKTGVLDAFFETYAAFNTGRDPGDWMPFLDWVAAHYDRADVKARFAEKLGAGIHWDAVLGRE